MISAKLSDPQFEGQTKTKLGNPGMAGFVQSIVNARLAEFLEENPQDARRGDPQGRVGRAGARGGTQGARPHPPQVGARELDAAGQARRLLGQGSGAGRAVRRRGRLRRRLGGRAPATATRRRSCRCAARSSTSRRAGSTRCSRNTEVQALITAIGTGVRDEFDIAKARYHKIVLLTDADVDGAHIRTLALTLLFREMQPLIEAGYVYIAKPPLYRLTRGPEAPLHRARIGARGDPARRQVRADRGHRPRRQAVQADRSALDSGSRGCSSSTRAGPRRFAPPTATGSSRSCSRRGCSRSGSPTPTRCSRTSRPARPTATRTPPSCSRRSRRDGRQDDRGQDRPGDHPPRPARGARRQRVPAGWPRSTMSWSRWSGRRRSRSGSATTTIDAG